MIQPLYIEVHDDCDAEIGWIKEYRIAGQLSAAEEGGKLIYESDKLELYGVGDKPRFRTVQVDLNTQINIYAYVETHAVMHVAVHEEEALILTLTPYEIQVDRTGIDALAVQRLMEWWNDHGKLRKL